MKRFLVLLVGLGLFALPAAHAETASGHVTSLGCHNVDNECWVTFDGYGNSAYCNHTNQLRWSTSTTWGNRWYTTLLSAYALGKTVSVLVASDYCSGQGYPTFIYGTMSD